MSGTISSVEDHGTIVIVWIDLDGVRRPVYMDHRAFGWLAESEGIESVGDLIGRHICFNGESIEFLDTVEAA